MAESVANRVLIPDNVPGRARLERLLRDDGWQPCTYSSPGEAEQAMAESPASAILLFGPGNEPRQAQLVKQVRSSRPETIIVGIGTDRAGAETLAGADETIGSDTTVSANSTPEEIALAVRMGDALRREQEAADTLRQEMNSLEERIRLQTERISELESSCDELREWAASAQEMALHDELTGLYNRRHFLQVAAQELARAHRDQGRFAIALIDIDHFKECNDTHGHVVGDQVLRELSKALVANLRRMDTVARYGGEEFVALLPQTGASDEAPFDPAGSMERLRSNVAEMSLHEDIRGTDIHLTLSAGIVEYPRDGETVEELIAEADARLYRAKSSGRNCICVS